MDAADDGDGNGICFPYDVLLDILRRLPSRAVAGSRCVCRAWRGIVDAHDLLLFPRYFPQGPFPGIFVNKIGCDSDSAFFAPPDRHRHAGAGAGAEADGLVFPNSCERIHHSCNGLLLVQDWGDHYVCNPATARRSAPLPQPQMPPTRRPGAMFLAFDPAESLHYQVFFFQEEVPPGDPEPRTWVDLEQTYITRLFGEEQLSEEEEQQQIEGDEPDDKTETEKEQFGFPSQSDEVEDKSLMSPSTSHILFEESLPSSSKHSEVSPLEQLQQEGFEEPKEKLVTFTVYSSCTGHWENREFTPGCCAPRHLYDQVTTSPGGYKDTVWSSEYWRGSLYMHCHNSILVILQPLKGTYNMVELPGEPCGEKGWFSFPANSVLASYERGIHYVAIKEWQLRVWMLTKSTDCQLGWTLSHEVNLYPHCHMVDLRTIQPRVTWEVVQSSVDRESIYSDENYENSMTEGEYNDGVEEDGDETQEMRSTCGSKHSWNSDEDNFIDVVEDTAHLCPPRWPDCQIMGFHPYKCALVLQLMSAGAVVVYHLDTSRLQYLGDDYKLIKDSEQPACYVYSSFPYRPCYADVPSASS